MVSSSTLDVRQSYKISSVENKKKELKVYRPYCVLLGTVLASISLDVSVNAQFDRSDRVYFIIQIIVR